MTRALIAEDEPLLAAALQAEFHKLWPGLQIAAVARNGVEALRQIQADPPDVAFLDIRMPGMTGLEVAQTIAEAGSPTALPRWWCSSPRTTSSPSAHSSTQRPTTCSSRFSRHGWRRRWSG